MKSHLAEEVRIAHPRFHHSTRDGLYSPIAFMFVTRNMRDEILSERQTLLSLLPPALHERQQKLFARYDPEVGAAAFKQLLRLYGYPFSSQQR